MANDKLFNKQKIRNEASLCRREKQKLITTTILIVGEGVTEYNYFNGLRRAYRGHKHRVNIILEKAQGSAPINLVDFALAYADKNGGIDYIFCVFDRDEHATFASALDKLNNYKLSKSAKSKPEFKAITSTPCFEIWILLHFKFTTKSYSRNGAKSPGDNVYKDLLKEFPEYSKTRTDLFELLYTKLDTGLINAEKLSKNNLQSDAVNPSTNMHELINFIRNR